MAKNEAGTTEATEAKKQDRIDVKTLLETDLSTLKTEDEVNALLSKVKRASKTVANKLEAHNAIREQAGKLVALRKSLYGRLSEL